MAATIVDPYSLLEPEVVAMAGTLENQHRLLAVILSLAISMKRIADDHAAALKAGGVRLK